MQPNDSISLHGVYVVWHRHVTVYLQSWFVNCIAPIYEPLLYLLAFGYGVGPLVGNLNYNGQMVSYLHFFAPAMIVMACCMDALHEGSSGTFIMVHFTKMWQSRLTTRLTFDEILLGDLGFAVTRGLFMCNLVGVVAFFFGAIPIGVLISIQPVLFLGAILMGALGIILSCFSDSHHQLGRYLSFLITPMLILSGAFFPRSMLPTSLKVIADLTPLSPILDLARFHIDNSHLSARVIWLAFLSVSVLYFARMVLFRTIFNIERNSKT